MPSNQPKTVDAEPAPDAPIPVIWTPPTDPGDAGGVGNSAERMIVPGTLHGAAEVTLTQANIQISAAR